MYYLEPVTKKEFETTYNKATRLDYGLLMISGQGELVATDNDNLKYITEKVWYSQVVGVAIDPEDGKKYTVADMGYQGSSLDELYQEYTEHVVRNNEAIEEHSCFS